MLQFFLGNGYSDIQINIIYTSNYDIDAFQDYSALIYSFSLLESYLSFLIL